MEKRYIGIGFMVKAMQMEGFGHEEIMAVREAMITGDWSNVKFVHDALTDKWDEAEQLRIKG